MKKSKTAIAILAMTVVILIAGQPEAEAGEGLDIWPLSPGANGEIFFGTLVIIYTPVANCEYGETGVTMTFHLTLYKNRSNSWTFMSTDAGPPAPRSGSYCLFLDVDLGEQQAALTRFLDNEVGPGLKGGKFSQIFLKKVDEDFYDTRLDLDVVGPPDYTVANVEVVGAK